MDKRIQKLIDIARESGYIIRPLQEIHQDKLDSSWYDGKLFEINSDDYRVCIGAYGDVRAKLYAINSDTVIAHANNRNNREDFYEVMKDLIPTDECLYQLQQDGRLVFDLNNWFEVSVFDKKAQKYVGPDVLDNIMEGSMLDELTVESIQGWIDYCVSYSSDVEKKDKSVNLEDYVPVNLIDCNDKTNYGIILLNKTHTVASFQEAISNKKCEFNNQGVDWDMESVFYHLKHSFDFIHISCINEDFLLI